MHLEQKEIITFDVDGVLLDTVSKMIKWVKKVCDEMWIESNSEFHKKHASNPKLPQFLLPDSIEKQIKAEKIYTDFMDESNYIPDLIKWTEETFKQIKENNKEIALCSSKMKWDIDRIMKHYWLSKFIDMTIWKDCVSFNKPDPEWLIRIMKYFWKSKDDLIMLWDSHSDYWASKNAEIDFLWVNSWVYSWKEWDKLWVENINSIKDLLK
jgi:beta-phosphoglucomutase-like phosphatase (HAD superfamily)